MAPPTVPQPVQHGNHVHLTVKPLRRLGRRIHQAEIGLRVLTVRQPWASAIAHLSKSPENRPTNIAGSYRGPVAIHAAAPKSKADEAAYMADALASPYADWAASRDRFSAFTEPLYQGVVLAVAELVDVHHADGCYDRSLREAARLCSPWAMPDQWHLVLANVRPLAAPIPHKGGLGLRIAPAALEAAIREQVPT